MNRKYNEDKTIFERAQKNDREAIRKIVEENYGLVVSMARKYSANGNFDDLVQEGLIGLLKAIEKYDPNLGWKFSTFATWWIRDEIMRFILKNSNDYKIPVNLTKKLFKLQQYQRQFYHLTGREPTDEELMQLSGYDKKIIKFYRKYMFVNDISLEEVTETFNTGDENLEDYLLKNMLEKRLAEAIEQLSEEEKKVINLKYALVGEERYTYSKIAEVLNISRKKVKQIEEKALNKIKKYLEIV